MSIRWIGLGLMTCLACQYTSPGTVEPPIPDAGECVDINIACTGDFLRSCSGPGAAVEQQTCTWGCDVLGTPHCRRVTPSSNAVVASDLDPDNFVGIMASSSLAGVIDGGLGTINGTPASSMGIGYTLLANDIAVFRFKALSIGAVKVTGTHAIAVVSDGAITITGPLDVTGQCEVTPEIAGAGGGNGGETSGADGHLIGSGNGGANILGGVGGGGGGGWGGVGGASGKGEFGGVSSGDAVISMLRGGAGGGAGNGTTGFRGGGGGGAIQLVSNTRIEFQSSGSINAGGCGGVRGAGAGDEGGGGGAGGTILLEAPIIILGATNTLAVNGGGGGGGGGGQAQSGQPGGLSRTRASGGTGANGANGGGGGAGGSADGQPGTITVLVPGGGGGAVGWIRITTRDGTGAMIGGTMSPAFGDPQSTATQGTALTQ